MTVKDDFIEKNRRGQKARLGLRTAATPTFNGPVPQGGVTLGPPTTVPDDPRTPSRVAGSPVRPIPTAAAGAAPATSYAGMPNAAAEVTRAPRAPRPGAADRDVLRRAEQARIAEAQSQRVKPPATPDKPPAKGISRFFSGLRRAAPEVAKQAPKAMNLRALAGPVGLATTVGASVVGMPEFDDYAPRFDYDKLGQGNTRTFGQMMQAIKDSRYGGNKPRTGLPMSGQLYDADSHVSQALGPAMPAMGNGPATQEPMASAGIPLRDPNVPPPPAPPGGSGTPPPGPSIARGPGGSFRQGNAFADSPEALASLVDGNGGLRSAGSGSAGYIPSVVTGEGATGMDNYKRYLAFVENERSTDRDRVLAAENQSQDSIDRMLLRSDRYRAEQDYDNQIRRNRLRNGQVRGLMGDKSSTLRNYDDQIQGISNRQVDVETAQATNQSGLLRQQMVNDSYKYGHDRTFQGKQLDAEVDLLKNQATATSEAMKTAAASRERYFDKVLPSVGYLNEDGEPDTARNQDWNRFIGETFGEYDPGQYNENEQRKIAFGTKFFHAMNDSINDKQGIWGTEDSKLRGGGEISDVRLSDWLNGVSLMDVADAQVNIFGGNSDKLTIGGRSVTIEALIEDLEDRGLKEGEIKAYLSKLPRSDKE